MILLSEKHPIARKRHQCDFCYGAILPGTRYLRQTNIIDGDLGDFVCHEHCQDVAHMLNMYDDVDPDYGLTNDMFAEVINDYIHENHYDDEADDIASDWQNLSREQEVLMVYEELMAEKGQKHKKDE